MNNISVIVPVYNEENNLQNVLNEILSNLKKTFNDFEIIVVDDCSKDNSYKIAEKFSRNSDHKTKVIKQNKNYGSGKTIFIGIQQAKYDLIIYIPADGQFDCTEIIQYAIAGKNADIVLGVRNSRFDYSFFRKLSSCIFINSFNFLYNCKYKDINWIHLWRKEIFKDITIYSEGVFFLGEIVAKAKIKNYRIVEIPSLYRPRISGQAKGGKISSIVKTIIEMLRTRFNYTKP